MPEKVCALCGRRYVGRSLSKYCGDACRAKAKAAYHKTPEYRSRQRESRRAERAAIRASAEVAVSGISGRLRHELRMLFVSDARVEEVFMEEVRD